MDWSQWSDGTKFVLFLVVLCLTWLGVQQIGCDDVNLPLMLKHTQWTSPCKNCYMLCVYIQGLTDILFYTNFFFYTNSNYFGLLLIADKINGALNFSYISKCWVQNDLIFLSLLAVDSKPDREGVMCAEVGNSPSYLPIRDMIPHRLPTHKQLCVSWTQPC